MQVHDVGQHGYDTGRFVARVKPQSFAVGDCVLIYDNLRVKTKQRRLELY